MLSKGGPVQSTRHSPDYLFHLLDEGSHWLPHALVRWLLYLCGLRSENYTDSLLNIESHNHMLVAKETLAIIVHCSAFIRVIGSTKVYRNARMVYTPGRLFG